ncbi:GntR family transcriptional regulator [Brassicibacter mesophilus]|uniref:GntR family transcriptional regulator n=1 Tax=Brassicibacter mesophilus TaxID=745119 RepID=UPI003D2380F3
MSLDFDENIPIYLQIIEMIKREIVTGELNGGDKLSSVRELSQRLKVNPNTIQRAYQELEREGLTYTQRGMGTFVSEDKQIIIKLKKDMAIGVLDSFINGMKQLGFSNTEIIEMVNEKFKKED